MRKCGLSPLECVLFEDRSKNLKPAKELGMTTVLVGTNAEKTQYCDYCFEDVYQALLYFKNTQLFG